MNEEVYDDNIVAEVNGGIKFNSRLLKEVKHLEQRWTKTVFLDGIEDGWKRMSIAVMLENQSLMNEAASNKNEEIVEKLVPLVREVYTNLNAWNWVGIQPLLGATGLVYFHRRREDSLAIESEEITAHTRCLKRRIAADFGVMDTAPDIVSDIDSEILKDLWNNTGIAKEIDLNVKTEDQFRQEVVLLQDEMKIKNYEPTFLVVNDKIYRYYSKVFTNLDEKLKIYRDNTVPGVLLGHKGNGYYESGYVYSPYVPFTYTPISIESKKFGLLNRYGKKLVRDGSKHYGKLIVKLTKELEEKL